MKSSLLHNKKINILTTEYTIKIIPIDVENDGETDLYKHIIKINKTNMKEKKWEQPYFNEVVRHELIHAFMHESGLSDQVDVKSSWVHNEGAIDWIAMKWPQIEALFKELGVEE